MSQMPDKIWLHKDTKYNTGDIVCGYQYEFAEGIEDEGGIENFVEYVPKDTFIEKVMNFLNYKLDDVIAIRVPGTIIPHHIAKQELMEVFKKYV